ncbi:MAG: toxin-antitoxin system YwqK family antitoxin [Limisphaerales bacterium]
MNPPSPTPGFESPRRWRRAWLTGLLGAAVLTTCVWLGTRPAPLPETVEVSRDHLVLRAGRLYLPDATVPFSGLMQETHEAGTPRSRSRLVAGQLEGLSEGWHTNGVKQIEEHFRGGVSHGRRTKWDENGQKLSEAQIVEGRLEGVFRRWHADGTLAEELPMTAGQPDGLARAFYPSGCLKAEARLLAGQVREQHQWQDGERPGVTLNPSTTVKLSAHP